MTDQPLISVVIPAFNRRDSVLQLLGGLQQQQGVSFEIIVVDDKSPDDTADAVAAAFPRVRVLRNEQNGGPAVSRNRGVRAARGLYVVGIDSDVTVTDTHLLRRVADTFQRFPKATGLAFRLLCPDGKTDDAPRWWHPVPLAGYADKRFATHYFSGTGYAFRRDEMIAAGLFPEVLYMHYEEVELAFRILDAGGTILHCPDLPVLHHAHPVSNRSKIKVFYKPRNQILVALTCYPWPRALAYLAPRLGYGLAMATIRRHLGEFAQAVASARALAPRCLAARRPLQRSTWQTISRLHRGVVVQEA